MKKLYAYKRLDRGTVSMYDKILKTTRTSTVSFTEVKHFADIDTQSIMVGGDVWVREPEYDITLKADEGSA